MDYLIIAYNTSLQDDFCLFWNENETFYDFLTHKKCFVKDF